MSFRSVPHLSSALVHLRASVMACAAVLALAVAGQIIVWAVVHFTDARTTVVQPDAAPQAESLRVVSGPPKAQTQGAPRNPLELGEAPSRAEVNRVPGEQDVFMRRTSMLVQSAGVIAAALLAVLMFQAVSIAGAANVPGVERAVSASTMAFVLAMLCLPLHHLLPDLQFHGLFVSYDSLVEASRLVRAGGDAGPSQTSFFAANLLMPGAVLLALGAVTLRFRAGVEAGVIVTSVSQLDEKLEREIRAMRTGQLAQPRAVGALNQAIGAAPMEAAPVIREPVLAPEPPRAAPPAFRPTADLGAGIPYNPGDSTKRPI